MADVPQVTVTAVAVFCIKWKIDSVSLAECNLIFTGLHGPDICHTPWCDDLDIRCKGFDSKLETDLVISLTGSAVADGNSVLFSGNFNQFLCNSRTCHGCTQEIFVFVYSTSLYAWYDEIVAELIYDIFDI